VARYSDITVAGAGIAGASTALALQRRGHRVTLIDKWGPGNSRASSTDYNRVIRAIQWEDDTCDTFTRLGVPHHRFSQAELQTRFPQFDVRDIAYGIYEPEAGMIMAHRAVISTVQLFEKFGGVVKRGDVTTDSDERPMLDGKPIQSDVTVIATGPWMADMFPEKIDIDNDERLIKRESLTRTRDYIRKRFPGLVGERVVDSKFNQVIITPDTHFIADWHPQHANVLMVGGCSGHLFKHGPVMGDFAAGLAVGDYDTAPRFKLGPRRKLTPAESPSGR